MDPLYLGDGVYLTHDGWQLWLCRDNHQNPVIALDPDVFLSLITQGTKMLQKIGSLPTPE